MESDSLLFTLMESGLAHCKVTVEESGGLLASLFLAGLVGSASHCVGMCGPFVLSQTVARLEAVPAADMREWRLTGAALVPYHLGRATTYGLLGVAAAYVASGVVDITGLGHLSAALMALGALFFLGYALRRLGVVVPALGGWLKTGGEGWWSRTVGRRARPLFDRPVGWRGYLLGILLGFLPCGLLYGALAAAAAGGDPLAALFAMLAFTGGTIPALLAIGLAGHVAGSQWQAQTAKVAPVLLLLNAGVLGYMAWRFIA